MKMPLFFENQLPLMFEASGEDLERETAVEVSKKDAQIGPQPKVVKPTPSSKRRKRNKKS
jgi:hypothetical protein